MNSDSTVPNTIVLNSWKEIASYVGRGVRTVQRWEADLGMPVRRPRAKSRSAVLAMSDEIDAWLRSAPTGDLNSSASVARLNNLEAFRRAIAEHSSLRDQCHQLRAENMQSLATLMQKLHALAESVQAGRAGATNITTFAAKRPTGVPLEDMARSAAAFND